MVILLLGVSSILTAQDPIMHWDFEKVENRASLEVVSGIADALEGNFEEAAAVRGNGIRLDGFTSVLRREAKNVKSPGDRFTVEAWGEDDQDVRPAAALHPLSHLRSGAPRRG
jgi:hypothetical protein